MARSKKKVSKSPKVVSPSSFKIEGKPFENFLFEAPRFDGDFDMWEIIMRTFLQSEGMEIWESVIDDSKMDGESKEYNARAAKTILDGLPDSVKKNLGKYSSAKDIWDRLHELHAKGALTMTMSQEENYEPIIEAENEKVDLIKLQMQERDEELAKLKKELDESKRKHHEEVISMTNQLNKAKKQEDALSSQLEQRHKRVNKLVEEIGQYKVEVSSLKSELQEAKKQAQEAEKKMESSQAEISKMKSDIISFKIVAAEATRSKEETEEQFAKKNTERERLEEEIVLLRKKVEGMNKIMKSSQALDDMLSYHRSPSDKSGLGYVGESSNKDENALSKGDVKKPERNGDAPSSSKDKEKNEGCHRRNPAPSRKPAPRRNVADGKDARGNGDHQGISRQQGFRSTSRKPPSPRYQSSFFGYCYSCSNFGHMAKVCRAFHGDRCCGPRQSPRNNFTRRNHDFLFTNNVECFKCHDIGHMARDCNLTWALTQARPMQKKKVTQVWRRKERQSENPLNSPVDPNLF